jgi:hypothetical protein
MLMTFIADDTAVELMAINILSHPRFLEGNFRRQQQQPIRNRPRTCALL